MQLVKTGRDNLLRPLQTVSGIVERRHTLPILANILIRKEGNAVSFLSTSYLYPSPILARTKRYKIHARKFLKEHFNQITPYCQYFFDKTFLLFYLFSASPCCESA